MFGGVLLSSGLRAPLVGGICFFLLWQVSAFVAQRVVASIIGILVVVLMNWLLVRSWRYRTRVRAYNVIVHARVCAGLALTVGSPLRIGKLIFTTSLFVGRLDRPFLGTIRTQVVFC